MGLADTLRAAPRGRTFRQLALDVVLEQVDGEDRSALLAALNDPLVTAPTIADALRSNGFLVDIKDPDQAVRAWRSRHRG
jgi:hypothetical protein